MRMLFAFLLLSAPAVLNAQQATVVPAGAPSSPQGAAIAELRSALRNLVVGQESFYADSSTYTSRLAALGRFLPDSARGITIEIRDAGQRGWRGVATHRDAPGLSCVVFVGHTGAIPATAAQKIQPVDADEGKAICDDPAAPR